MPSAVRQQQYPYMLINDPSVSCIKLAVSILSETSVSLTLTILEECPRAVFPIIGSDVLIGKGYTCSDEFLKKSLEEHKDNLTVLKETFDASGFYGAAKILCHTNKANEEAVVDVIDSAKKLFQGLLQGNYNFSIYQEKGGGPHAYGKYLIASNAAADPNSDFKLSIQLFAFQKGQITPAHNHPCYCVSLYLGGDGGENVTLMELRWDENKQELASINRPIGDVQGLLTLAATRIFHALQANSRAWTLHIYFGIGKLAFDGLKTPAAVDQADYGLIQEHMPAVAAP